MKIVLVIPTLKQGGAEKIMCDLANAWADKDYSVHLILLATGKIFYALNKNVIVHNLDFVNTGKFGKPLKEAKIFFKLRKLLKKINPEFVLSFMEKYNTFTILAASFLKLKVVVSDRSNPRKKIPFSIKMLRRITYKYAAGIIAQTSLAKEILRKETRNKNIEVISNPLKAYKNNIICNKENIILNVGRLVPEKGQIFLIESFAKLNNKSWKLVILGEGALRLQLENHIRELKIADQVFMPGAVNNIDEWLAKSSIFAFTSLSEGFPNSLLEAMSAGLPCVSFDCDAGPREIIENGKNGFLLPLRDVDGFSKTLETLINNEAMRNSIGTEAKKVSQKFDFNIIADNYLNFCLKK